MDQKPPKLHIARRALLGAAFVLFPSACGVMGYQAPPVSPAMKQHSRASTEVLQRGYLIHQAKCGKCHPFEDPADYSPEELRNDVMPPMARKSKLDAADEAAVLEYLLAVRKLPPPAPAP